MSWKSLVTAGLLCVLASPAFAAPQLDIISGGLDPTTSQWIWNVRIAPTAAGSPLDAELAFGVTAGGGIKSVTNDSPAIWDYNNPGNAPASYAWVVNYGAPPKPEALEINCTGCTATNTAASGGTKPTTVVAGALNQIFVALGSKDLVSGDLTQAMIGTANLGTSFITIKTASPTNSSLTSTIALSGAYDSNTSGRIAETTGTNTSANYKNFSGSASRTIVNGDMNLDGKADGTDFGIFGGQYAPTVPNAGGWTKGDFNGDGFVDGTDFGIFGGAYNPSAPAGGTNTPLSKIGVVDPPGAGSGSGLEGGSVPEPASIALMGLAFLGGLGLYGRKR
jgi:hypothetical protein